MATIEGQTTERERTLRLPMDFDLEKKYIFKDSHFFSLSQMAAEKTPEKTIDAEIGTGHIFNKLFSFTNGASGHIHDTVTTTNSDGKVLEQVRPGKMGDPTKKHDELVADATWERVTSTDSVIDIQAPRKVVLRCPSPIDTLRVADGAQVIVEGNIAARLYQISGKIRCMETFTILVSQKELDAIVQAKPPTLSLHSE